MANDEKRTKLAKRLYPNLATWEILLWTAGWIFGVGYSIYHVYLASKRKKMIVLHLALKNYRHTMIS